MRHDHENSTSSTTDPDSLLLASTGWAGQTRFSVPPGQQLPQLLCHDRQTKTRPPTPPTLAGPPLPPSICIPPNPPLRTHLQPPLQRPPPSCSLQPRHHLHYPRTENKYVRKYLYGKASPTLVLRPFSLPRSPGRLLSNFTVSFGRCRHA